MGVASHGVASTLAWDLADATVTNELVVTPQGAATLTDVLAAPFFIEVAQAGGIADGSVVNLTFSKAPTNPNEVTAELADASLLSYSGATNDGKTLNFTLGAALAADATIKVSLAEFAIADVSTTPITADVSFTNVGSGIDPAAAKLELITLTAKDQFGLEVTAGADGTADGVVDVEAARYAFAGAGVTNDVIVFGTSDTDSAAEVNAAATAQNGTTVGATLTGVTYVITGDFSWAEDIAEDPVVEGFQLATGAVACAQGVNAVAPLAGDNAPTATTYTIATTTADDVTCTLTPQDAALKIVLPTTEFSVSSTVAYDDLANDATVAGTAAATAAAGKQVIAAVDAGEWTINGAETTVFAVPFGAEVESHSIFVSNSGATTGAISASMRWNGNDPVVFSLGNIEAGANKYLNIIEALTAAGELPPFGRADITFTVNAPKAAIAITAGYNTANGRTNLFVEDQTPIDTL